LYTNSSNARKILENWQELYKNFVKITPLDYRRALLEKSKNNFIKASVA
jgi:glutamate synthase domain-containing protein 3